MYRAVPSSSPGHPRRRGGGGGRCRRGVVSVLAMVYLVLFATLAIGAYSAITTSAQASYNQRDVNAARAAAESGMEFVRFQLYQLNIPHNTPPASMFATIYTQLGAAL